jgi:hypothetical protein
MHSLIARTSNEQRTRADLSWTRAESRRLDQLGTRGRLEAESPASLIS